MSHLATATRVTNRGTYLNPVIFADYSDPDVIRVGDTWYLTASSFSNLPGLPVLASRDLVEWTIVGNALPVLGPRLHFRTPRRGGGVWAPALRYEAGVFSITYPDPDFGIFRIDAADPAGPWSEPLLIDATPGGIDPCPFIDDDGSRWLVKGWAKSRSGINNRITLHRLDPRGVVADPGQTIIDGGALGHVETSLGTLPWITIEGPKLYKTGGWYYLFVPAGGVKVGWQGVFRSRSLQGPWEGRNVMDQGSNTVNGPHQGALVDGPDGRWWFLHFQDQDSWGRVVHLQSVAWKDGWPVIGEGQGDRGQPVLEAPLPYPEATFRAMASVAAPSPAPQSFDAGLHGLPSPLWQWQANPEPGWVVGGAPGALRLACTSQSPNPWENPAVLTRKLEGPACVLTVKVALSPRCEGEEAGVAAVAQRSVTLGLRRVGGKIRLVWREWPSGSNPALPDTQVDLPEAATGAWLRLGFVPVEVAAVSPPDSPWASMKIDRLARVTAWWSPDGRDWRTLGVPVDVPPGRWVGAQTGVYAVAPSGTPAFAATRNGFADFSEGTWAVGGGGL